MSDNNEERPQNKHLKPIHSTDDPRYLKLAAGREKYNNERKAAKARRTHYREELQSFKEVQLGVTQSAISDGDVLDPANMLLDMIKQQQLILSDPDLKEQPYREERKLMLELYKQYATLTGANAPNSQSLDVTTENDKELSPDEITSALDKFYDDMKVVDNKDIK